MMVRAPRAVDLLADPPGAPQRPFSSCSGPPAITAERGCQDARMPGCQDARWREQMANSEFASSISFGGHAGQARGGELEQQRGFARHALQVGHQLALHTLFGLGADTVDGGDEQVGQRVGDLAPTDVIEGG